MQKLCCYVDETGQDTHGTFFLVAVVVTEKEQEYLRAALEQIEQQTQKGRLKWQKTVFARRTAYLNAIFATPLLAGKVFFARYAETKVYLDLTIYTTAKAILKKTKGPYRTTVWVDGLGKQEARRFERGLRGLKIKVRKVRGLQEESDPLMRLADAAAGFIRDALEGRGYAQELYREAIRKGIIREV